jgi:hypothetical protein
MADSEPPSMTDDMERFTATGRPFKPANPAKDGWSMDSMSVTESFGAAPANLLPVRYNDESLISVPVLRPEAVGKGDAPKAKRSIFSRRRKSQTENFTMKSITRGEYLKHYAKDDEGKYCGAEAPAEDCILRGEDLIKYRTAVMNFKHEIETAATRPKDEVIR